MAIDSASKRASAIGVGSPFITAIIPDGNLDQGDRQTMSSAYSGILAIASIVQKIGNVLTSFKPDEITAGFKPDDITTSFKPDEITVKFN